MHLFKILDLVSANHLLHTNDVNCIVRGFHWGLEFFRDALISVLEAAMNE